MVRWDEQWVEAFALFLLVLGFILAVALVNPLFSYISVFLAGGMAGRIFYQKRYKTPILPSILIIVGFFLGYLIGGFWVSRLLIILFFVLGFGISYYLHIKKILVIFKSKNFIK